MSVRISGSYQLIPAVINPLKKSVSYLIRVFVFLGLLRQQRDFFFLPLKMIEIAKYE